MWVRPAVPTPIPPVRARSRPDPVSPWTASRPCDALLSPWARAQGDHGHTHHCLHHRRKMMHQRTKWKNKKERRDRRDIAEVEEGRWRIGGRSQDQSSREVTNREPATSGKVDGLKIRRAKQCEPRSSGEVDGPGYRGCASCKWAKPGTSGEVSR